MKIDKSELELRVIHLEEDDTYVYSILRDGRFTSGGYKRHKSEADARDEGEAAIGAIAEILLQIPKRVTISEIVPNK